MKNLFIIYLGGSHPQSLIELHDMRFVVADKIEETYPMLRQSWWGKPESLHLDAWGILKQADGHTVSIIDKPANTNLKLFFVNLGGYDSKEFTELHKNIFIVAENPQQAKLKAVKTVQAWEVPHRDYMYEVDDVLNVNAVLGEQQFIHLEKTETIEPFEFICKYTPIGK